MRVVVTAANGFIGAGVTDQLAARGHTVTALVRDPKKMPAVKPGVKVLAWDTSKPGDWREAIAFADAVVHLAGAPVGGHRWTDEFKKILRSSRIDTTRAVVDAMSTATQSVSLISGSAVGYYGDCGDRVVTESDGPGSDFLAKLCTDWEAETHKAVKSGSRVVLLRTGIVLGDGGALQKMVTPFRFGLGGPLGSGKQWMPWIHLDDTVSMIVWAVENSAVCGPVNVTSPNPVTMRDFATTLGKVMHRPSFMPAPAFALKIVLGEFAHAVLTGQRAVPEAATNGGFVWKYPTLQAALQSILGH